MAWPPSLSETVRELLQVREQQGQDPLVEQHYGMVLARLCNQAVKLSDSISKGDGFAGPYVSHRLRHFLHAYRRAL